MSSSKKVALRPATLMVEELKSPKNLIALKLKREISLNKNELGIYVVDFRGYMTDRIHVLL